MTKQFRETRPVDGPPRTACFLTSSAPSSSSNSFLPKRFAQLTSSATPVGEWTLGLLAALRIKEETILSCIVAALGIYSWMALLLICSGGYGVFRRLLAGLI